MKHDEEEVKKSFSGVWIPHFIYLHPDLSSADREVLGIIDSLSKGGFVSVEYIAELRKVLRSTQSTQISKLEKRGYVKRLSTRGRCNQIVLTAKAKNPPICENSNTATEHLLDKSNTYPFDKSNTNPFDKSNTNRLINQTQPVGYIKRYNISIDKTIKKEIEKCPYSGVTLTAKKKSITNFIELWESVAKSGEWPVIIESTDQHAIEYFGDEIQKRLGQLLETRTPEKLLEDICEAVDYLIDDTHRWASEEFGNEFGIAWHLNALDDREGRRRWQGKKQVNYESSSLVNQGASPLLRSAHPPGASIEVAEASLKQRSVANKNREITEQQRQLLTDLRMKVEQQE